MGVDFWGEKEKLIDFSRLPDGMSFDQISTGSKIGAPNPILGI